jgi:hypothetical protein
MILEINLNQRYIDDTTRTLNSIVIFENFMFNEIISEDIFIILRCNITISSLLTKMLRKKILIALLMKYFFIDDGIFITPTIFDINCQLITDTKAYYKYIDMIEIISKRLTKIFIYQRKVKSFIKMLSYDQILFRH